MSWIWRTSSRPLMPGIWTSTSTRSTGCSATMASASLASRAVDDVVPDAREDALEGAAVELLVVDDEDVGLAQRDSSAERRGAPRV